MREIDVNFLEGRKKSYIDEIRKNYSLPKEIRESLIANVSLVWDKHIENVVKLNFSIRK